MRRRLERTLTGLSRQRLERLLKASVRHRAESAALALWAGRCPADEFCRRVSLSGWNHLRAAREGSAPAQLVTTRIGCWEVLAAALLHFHGPFDWFDSPPVCSWRRLARRRLTHRFAASGSGGGRLLVLEPDAARRGSSTLEELARQALARGLPLVPALAFSIGGGRARAILRTPLPLRGPPSLLADHLSRALEWEVLRRPAAWPWAEIAWRNR